MFYKRRNFIFTFNIIRFKCLFWYNFFSDLTYNIYFPFEKQAFNGLSKVIGRQKSLGLAKRDFILEKHHVRLCNSVTVLYYPLPFYGTKIIDPFRSSMILANHDKVEQF